MYGEIGVDSNCYFDTTSVGNLSPAGYVVTDGNSIALHTLSWPNQRQQKFYEKLCEFYLQLDEELFLTVQSRTVVEGNEINYKEFYKALKKEFRCKN